MVQLIMFNTWEVQFQKHLEIWLGTKTQINLMLSLTAIVSPTQMLEEQIGLCTFLTIKVEINVQL